ncbi:MAG: alpha-amylase family glycosyl hydrolase [Acholeplasma sp.]|nr:alpha-amylase family glycosyl hydrolase [Acholeplasma sp.]
MKCFIDDFNLVRIESDEYIYEIKILDEELTHLKNEGYSQYFKSSKEIPLHIVDRIKINGKHYPLNIGLVTLTDHFEKKYRYDGFLGNKYHKEYTEFAVFSPVAKEISVVIENEKHQMEFKDSVWYTRIDGDLELKNYVYEVRLVDAYQFVIDPYAIAGNNDYSTIIDISKTVELINKPIVFKNHLKSVIYEAHIRDLTTFLDLDNKGTYLGLTEKSSALGNISVLDYVKKLGITHIQLLPVQDFIGVDDFNKDKAYNWGYNPQQYFVLEGWFSSEPANPYTRINEFKKLVDYAHKIKLGVNIDVVYNHVYQRGMFPYDKLVPGYFFRHDKTFKPTNSSFVGNDVETRNYMVRRLIIDSLKYFSETFKLDGFRFDLMGLLDLETMKEIEKELKVINPSILLYGEGWNMDNALKSSERSNINNNILFPYYGHFNDYYRNIMKGNLHTDELGYAFGNSDHLSDVKRVILGSKNIFKNPQQSLNYIECHDNLTFYDQMILAGISSENLKDFQDFANHALALSKGMIFYHAGQEFYRTKQLVENSYNSNDEINGIRWDFGNEVIDLKKIIKIRNRYLNKKGEALAIEKRDNLLLYTIKNDKNTIICYLKNDYLENVIHENGSLLFKSKDAINQTNDIIVNKPGVYIFLRK